MLQFHLYKFFRILLLDKFKKMSYTIKANAAVMELADVADSKSAGSDTVPVRLRPAAPKCGKSY